MLSRNLGGKQRGEVVVVPDKLLKILSTVLTVCQFLSNFGAYPFGHESHNEEQKPCIYR